MESGTTALRERVASILLIIDRCFAALVVETRTRPERRSLPPPAEALR